MLGDFLRIIATGGNLKEKWFDFGYNLDLTISQLNKIESISTSPVQCTRRVILHWRNVNRSETWEPLAKALAKIDLHDLAHKLKDHFDPPSEPEPVATLAECWKGIYCRLCDEYHLKFDNIKQHLPSKSWNTYISTII